MRRPNVNVYATNRGGIIRAPHAADKCAPKSSVIKGDDLRVAAKKQSL